MYVYGFYNMTFFKPVFVHVNLRTEARALFFEETCFFFDNSLYVPRLKMQIFLFHSQISQIIDTCMTTNMLESYLIKTSFCLVIIGIVWHLFSNFKMKRTKKVYFENLTHI